VAFCGTLLILNDEVGRGGATSLLLVVAGFLYPMNHLYEWGGVLATRLSMIGSTAFWWVSACACLLYPQQRLEKLERGYLALLGIGLGAPEVYLLLVGQTYEAIFGFDWLVFALGMGFPGVMFMRFRRYRGVERRTLTPVLIVGVTLACVGGASWYFLISHGIYTSESDQHVIDITYLVQGIALLLFAPVGFIIAGLKRRFVHADVADTLARLPPGATPEELREALQKAMGDSRVDILYWSLLQNAYVDANGQSVDLSQPSSDRVTISLHTDDDEAPVLLLIDRQAARESVLFGKAVVSAPKKSVLLAWIAHKRDLQRQYRARNRRVEEAHWVERIRLERDLHDGVQQRLYALLPSVAVAKKMAGDHPVGDVIENIGRQLDDLFPAFRAMLQGIAPRELVKCGLPAALDELVGRQDQNLTIKTNFTPRRAPEAIEYIAYFVACEAFTNIVKHARATRVELETTLSDDNFALKIADNGTGGAEANPRTGLAGLRDRVQALGGELILNSPRNGGTELTVRIPCE